MRRLLPGLLAATLLLAGCGDDDAETAATETETTTETDTATETETETVGTSTSTTTASSDLPGERIEIFPYEGTTVAVVGVPADDVLNVRAAPDPAAEVVAELDPLADGMTATGHNRQLAADALWAQIDTGDVRGWVNATFLGHVGATEDATAGLYPSPEDRPLADTLTLLAEEVADAVAQADGAGPRIVIVDGPSVGDLGEVTVDVLGFPDDSVLGLRLRIFAEEEGGEAFRLRMVESTTLCRRGVSDGLCV